MFVKHKYIDSKKERKLEVKEHYKILTDDLKNLAQSIGFETNKQPYIPTWRWRIEIISPVIPIMTTDFVKNHLEVDHPCLLEEIKEYIGI